MQRKYPVEALWGVLFGTTDFDHGDPDFAGGVFVLDTGRVMGGDGGFYYTGRYEVLSNGFKAFVHVKKHNDFLESLLGDLDEYILDVNGEFQNDGDRIVFDSKVRGTNRTTVGACRWLAELP